MGFITAIDKAINKDHYSNEAEKEREHQEEMNKQFMDMLDKQMGEFDQQNAQIWGMVGESKAQNDDMWGAYFPQGGPNFDQGGNAAFDLGEGYSFDSVFQPGPNFDQTGGATYGGGQLPALPAGTDPYAGIPGGSGSGTTGDPTGGFGQAGIDNSWAMNTGGMFNMNDLIGYFDQRIAEQNRPAGMGDQPPGSGPDSAQNGGQTTIIVIQNGGDEGCDPSCGPGGSGKSDDVTGKPVDETPGNVGDGQTKAPTSEELTGEIEDLELLLDDAVDKGIISQDEADRLIRDLTGAVDGAEGDEDRSKVGEDIDRIGGQLGELEALQKQADSVLSELDARVEKGQISEEAATQVRKDIENGLAEAKDAVLDPGDSNSIFGKEFSDDDILSNVMSNLSEIDQDLNKLAKDGEKTNFVTDILEGVADAVGGPAGTAIDAAVETIETKQVDKQLETLEWT